MEDPINLAKFFHPHGFHRDKGLFPGIDLRDKLDPIVTEAVKKGESVTISLHDVKAIYGSFVDGAFGRFIDRYKDDFFKVFNFVGGKPEFLIIIRRVHQRHKEKNFNVGEE